MYSTQTQQRIEQMTQFFIAQGSGADVAQNQAIASIGNLVRREAYVMAYNDCFYFIACTLLLSGLTVIFMKKIKAAGGSAAH
jgi:MFS transporter, DHA2 family, multidrug resistance protein